MLKKILLIKISFFLFFLFIPTSFSYNDFFSLINVRLKTYDGFYIAVDSANNLIVVKSGDMKERFEIKHLEKNMFVFKCLSNNKFIKLEDGDILKATAQDIDDTCIFKVYLNKEDKTYSFKAKTNLKFITVENDMLYAKKDTVGTQEKFRVSWW